MKNIEYDSRLLTGCADKQLFELMSVCYDSVLSGKIVLPELFAALKQCTTLQIIDTCLTFSEAVYEQDLAVDSGYNKDALCSTQILFCFIAYIQETITKHMHIAREAFLCCAEGNIFTVKKLLADIRIHATDIKCLFQHEDVIALETTHTLQCFDKMRKNGPYVMLVHKGDKTQLYIPRHPMVQTQTLRTCEVSYINFSESFSSILYALYFYLAESLLPKQTVIGDYFIDREFHAKSYVSVEYEAIPISEKYKLPKDKVYAVLLYKEAISDEM